MVQPKTPPLSFRLAPDLVARVEAWAKKHKVTRNAAVAQLLEAGLLSTRPSLPTPERQAELKAVAQKVPGEVEALQQPTISGGLGAPGRREPIHVYAPQLGSFERKPYQKGTKK